MSEPQPMKPDQAEKRKRIFVSHSHETRDLASFISRELEAMGIDAWSDVDAPIGAEFRGWLKDKIQSSDAIVTLVTPSSLDSKWMQYELGLATGLDRLVIPVVVDVQRDQLPAQIVTRHTLRLDELDQIKELMKQPIAHAAAD